jgi:putative peptidoglycan lipid II flippase
VLIKVLVPNFFARKDTSTPVYTAAASLAINVALNLVLVPRYGVPGLAYAGAIAAWCNCGLLYAVLALRGYYHLTLRVLSRLARITLAAAAMGAALWYALPFGAEWYSGSAIERAASVGALVALGGTVFILAALALGVVDRQTIGQLRRRPA